MADPRQALKRQLQGSAARGAARLLRKLFLEKDIPRFALKLAQHLDAGFRRYRGEEDTWGDCKTNRKSRENVRLCNRFSYRNANVFVTQSFFAEQPLGYARAVAARCLERLS